MGLNVRAYSNATEFCEDFDVTRAGCVIFDGTPTVDGVPLPVKLASAPLTPPLICISGETDISSVIGLMRQGLTDYLPKRSFSEHDLWEAVQRGLTQDAKRRAAHAQLLERQSRLALLNEADRELLRLLLRGLNNREIATEIGITRTAVEGRRTRMMKKLGVTNLVALIRFAIEAEFDSEPSHST